MSAETSKELAAHYTTEQVNLAGINLDVVRKLRTTKSLGGGSEEQIVPLDFDLLQFARKKYSSYGVLHTIHEARGQIRVDGALSEMNVPVHEWIGKSPIIYTDAVLCYSYEEACDLFPKDADEIYGRFNYDTRPFKNGERIDPVSFFVKHQASQDRNPPRWSLHTSDADLVLLMPPFRTAFATQPDGLQRLGRLFPDSAKI